jgi:glycosyltransferase involved in cell wall biosynthesis
VSRFKRPERTREPISKSEGFPGRSAASRTKMRIVWTMNVAAPYRLPVWDALSRQVDLGVWLLAANEHNRRWSVPGAKRYGVTLLRTVGFRRGESVHYVLIHPVGRKTPTPDVIVLPGWDSPAAWQLMFWAKRRGVTTLIFNESTIQSHRFHDGIVNHIRSWFFRHIDGVLTVSPGSTEAALAAGVPMSRITELSNAVDVQAIHQKASLVGRPETSSPHTYLFVGQLIERKSPELVIEALTGQAIDSRLLIAGEGPLEQSLRDLVRRRGLQRRVEFLGYVQPADLSVVLGRCDTLVLSSQEEVYGLVVTEALAAGLHAVVSECAGVADVVRDMQGTWVVAPRLETLMTGMRASADAWCGPILTPAVLRHTPEAMAASIKGAACVTMGVGGMPR